MQPLTEDRFNELLAPQEPPCVSIYLPTRRTYPDLQQNAIQYKNLLRQAESALRERYPGSAVRALMAPLEQLADDAHFWSHRFDGLALFNSSAGLRRFDLQRSVPALAVVADSFHVKPLLRQLRTQDRYQVLCVTRNRVRLYEGDRHSLDEVDAEGLLTAVEAVIASSQRQEQRPAGDSPGEIEPAIMHSGAVRLAGNPAPGHDAEVPAERFFRAVDGVIWQRYSRPSGLPLVLAALPENQVIYRRVSHNDQLLPRGVDSDPEALSPQQLREAAWQAVAPRHQERLRQYLDSFQVARAQGKGSDDLAEVAKAAHVGRVGVLLLDADRHQPGRLDPDDGRPIPAEAKGANGPTDDVFDDLGELVLRRDGTVLVVSRESMPSDTGVAAVFRY